MPGWFSEPKNVAITVVVAAILAYKTYLFVTYVLPWLVTVTWNLVNLVIGRCGAWLFADDCYQQKILESSEILF